MRDARRLWLMQAGALNGSATLPLWVPRAAVQSTSILNALPRTALIIGNTTRMNADNSKAGNEPDYWVAFTLFVPICVYLRFRI